MSEIRNATTKDLRAEIQRREEAEMAERWRQLNNHYGACPECAGALREIDSRVTQEHWTAPGWTAWPVPPPPDWHGRELVATEVDTRLVCVNGHERWADTEFKAYGERGKRKP